MNDHDLLDKLEPVFNGMPVIVRLTTGDDILCVLYQSQDVSDTRMIMERPLRVIFEEVARPAPQDTTPHTDTKTIYTRIRTRFDRWMSLTDVALFPIFSDHVISIAPLSEQYVNAYIDWADQLYAPLSDTPSTPESSLTDMLSSSNTTSAVSDEAKHAYLDFILHNFTPKGKPN